MNYRENYYKTCGKNYTVNIKSGTFSAAKKRLIFAFAVIFALSFVLCGCASRNGDKVYTLYVPDGAPALAVAGVMNRHDINVVVVQPNTIAQYVGNGTADFAILPISAAATLYNGGVKIKLLSVNTHGNLYFVGKTAVTPGELKGKKIGVIGRGQVPDLTLRLLLNKVGVSFETENYTNQDAAHLLYCESGAAVIAQLKQNGVDYGFFAEPAVSNAVSKLGEQFTIAGDVQRMWAEAFDFEYPQGSLVVKSDIIKSDKKTVDDILNDIKANDDYAKNNTKSAIELIGSHTASGVQTTLNPDITQEIIDRCNIKTVKAADCKDDAKKYFELLTSLTTELDKPALEKVPDEEFYYIG